MVVNRNIELVQKYPRGSRGSPAKGVVWEDRSEGSNPSFCATRKKDTQTGILFVCGVNGVVREISNYRGFARASKNEKGIFAEMVASDTLAYANLPPSAPHEKRRNSRGGAIS